MGWIDRVEKIDGQLRPVGTGEHVATQWIRLVECKKYLSKLQAKSRLHTTRVDFRQLSECDPSEYTNFFNIHSDSGLHATYEITVAGTRVIFPTILLASALIGNIANCGEQAFSAASLNSVAVPVFRNDRSELRFRRRIRATAPDSLKNRFTWITCYPSGRRFWDSIYLNGSQGRFAACAIDAAVVVHFVGRRVGKTLYATRMEIQSLQPLEKPLPFFAKHCAQEYVFLEIDRTKMAAHLNTARRIDKLKTKIDDLPKLQNQWRTTDSEWQAIEVALHSKGLPILSRTRARIDLALEKYGSGRSWTEMGFHGPLAAVIAYEWRKTGRWDEMLRVLRDMRAGEKLQKP